MTYLDQLIRPLLPKGTIRGDLGTDRMRNVVHASDSPENAQVEIERFFSEQLVSV